MFAILILSEDFCRKTCQYSSRCQHKNAGSDLQFVSKRHPARLTSLLLEFQIKHVLFVCTFTKSTSTTDLSNNVRARMQFITQRLTQGSIVFLTSSLVCCSLSRLIPDFLFLLIIKLYKVPYNSFNKGHIQQWRGGDPLFNSRRMSECNMPHIYNPKICD